MPRSTIANRVGSIFDKLLELSDYSATSLSATTTGATFAFDCSKYADFALCIYAATQSGFTAGTNFWNVAIQVSATQAGTYKTVASADLDGLSGKRSLALNGIAIQGAVPDAKFMRLVFTKNGTIGNFTGGGFLTLNYC